MKAHSNLRGLSTGDFREALPVLLGVVQGLAELALNGYRQCLDCQDRLGQEGLPLYQLSGFHFQWTLLRSGLADEAEAQARAALPIHRQYRWHEAVARTQIVLAECARRSGQLEEARQALEPVWSTSRDRAWMEPALYCLLIDTWLLSDLGLWEESAEGAREGLEVARGCGYGLLGVDFKCALARAMLRSGDAEAAVRWAAEALDAAEKNLWGRVEALQVTELALRALRRGGDADSVGAVIENELRLLAELRDGLGRSDFRV